MNDSAKSNDYLKNMSFISTLVLDLIIYLTVLED